ncbi:hypothetical protein C8F04DRAFT_1192040 [Mycena alexandri]|uniref:Uncharacterized protein n=1 Tax=Mycena alexandri TaxID=1745969 RepID=A0AAD6SBM8_9AGAR|nr:hypothetical protein C8F04DRAFT_1192040 [Mycena alexandri]
MVKIFKLFLPHGKQIDRRMGKLKVLPQLYKNGGCPRKSVPVLYSPQRNLLIKQLRPDLVFQVKIMVPGGVLVPDLGDVVLLHNSSGDGDQHKDIMYHSLCGTGPVNGVPSRPVKGESESHLWVGTGSRKRL